MRRFVCFLGFLVSIALVLSGCGDDGLDIDKRTANRPPETVLTAGPPDSSSGVDYRVTVSWSGSDPDGTIDHWDFILVDHPAIADNIDGSGPHPVVVTIPERDDPRWTGTTARDSTFITLADTLRADPQPNDSTDADTIRQLPWERWHTFFVRAVDDRGLPDPTPDHVSFNATNIAPQVWLTDPVQPGRRLEARPTVRLRWDGRDPIGDGDALEPVAARWVVIDTQVDAFRQPTSFPESLYTLPRRFSWSRWFDWNSESGRDALLRNLETAQALPGGRTKGYYLFAVQVQDEAGAVSPVFDRVTPENNNVASIRVNAGLAPLVTVREPVLGIGQFVADGARVVRMAVAAGQEVSFRWEADASAYGAEALESRYAWDIVNPEDPADWDSDWCSDCRQAAPRAFEDGIHSFRLQVRDEWLGFTEVRFQLEVDAVSGERDILWVDDTREIIPNSGQEEQEDARWMGLLSEIARENGLDFNAARDVYDVAEEARFLTPPAGLVFRYKVVIWSARNAGQSPALSSLARFSDPFLEKFRNTTTHNYLSTYLHEGGRLWVAGWRPARLLWPELTNAQHQVAVNVTNWDDDPVEQHPDIDSVGTWSLLYSLGVETFDCGGGTGCGRPPLARDRLRHFCLAPQAVALQDPGLPDPPVLEAGPTWTPSPPIEGRPNVEIYNMPVFLSQQVPPLRPRPGRTQVLYTYTNRVPEDPDAGITYPLTADGQPVALLSKGDPAELRYSRALFGFEMTGLTPETHKTVAEYLLIRVFGLGTGVP